MVAHLPNDMELPMGEGGGAPSDNQPSRCSNAYDVDCTSAMAASVDLQMNTWHSNTCNSNSFISDVAELSSRISVTVNS